jgi:hypothetical protein
MFEPRPISADDLFQDLVLGFRVIPAALTVPVEGVDWKVGFKDEVAVSQDLIDRLINTTAQHFRDDPALELTGGFDSRLVAALALASGSKINRGFTIDIGASDDVDRAREIAQVLGIDHRVITPKISADIALEDALEFARASGWRANCVNYGWLPTVYRALDGFRTAQVGGVGGEIATGFYRSPLDRFQWIPGFFSLWCSLRLNRPSRLPTRLFRPDAFQEFRSRHIQNLRRCFDMESVRGELDWLDRCDRFYRDQRIASWAKPALAASGRWYEPRMPLLSREYVQWAFAVHPRQRGRQRQVILASECLSSRQDQWKILFGGTKPIRKSRTKRLLTVTSRLGLHAVEAPPIFAQFASTLARIPEFSRGVLGLAQGEKGDFGLDEQAVRIALQRPSEYTHELGALGTVAMSFGLVGQ